jgi:hypothetical protein
MVEKIGEYVGGDWVPLMEWPRGMVELSLVCGQESNSGQMWSKSSIEDLVNMALSSADCVGTGRFPSRILEIGMDPELVSCRTHVQD